MKYLDCSSVSKELMMLIEEAKQELTFVSYSLQISDEIKEKLFKKYRENPNLDITIIYGNTKLNDNDTSWISKIPTMSVYQKKNLHAKCYVSENKVIVSSMNLYEYSQTHNFEMGILFSKEENEEEWKRLKEDVFFLKCTSNLRYGKPKSYQLEQNEFSLQEQLLKSLIDNYYQNNIILRLQRNVLSNSIITKIIKSKTRDEIKEILCQENKIDALDLIFDFLEECERYGFFEVVETLPTNDIVLKSLNSGIVKTFYARKTLKLPEKDEIVAAKISNGYFNDFFILEKTINPFMPIPNGNTYAYSTALTSDLSSLTYQRQLHSILIRNYTRPFLDIYDYGKVVSFNNRKTEGYSYNEITIEFLSNKTTKTYKTKNVAPIGQIIAMRIYQGEATHITPLEFSKEKYQEEDYSKNDTGYCIKCGKKSFVYKERPFCLTCLRNNVSIEQHYCHICGKKLSNQITLYRPLCLECWKKDKDNS